jgi:hypothetical protein
MERAALGKSLRREMQQDGTYGQFGFHTCRSRRVKTRECSRPNLSLTTIAADNRVIWIDAISPRRQGESNLALFRRANKARALPAEINRSLFGNLRVRAESRNAPHQIGTR